MAGVRDLLAGEAAISSGAIHFALPLVAFVLAALGALGLPRRAALPVAHLLAALGSVAALVVALLALASGAVTEWSPFASAPFLRLAFRLDPLAAYFSAVISLAALASSIYALGYVRARAAHDAAWLGAGYALFVASMLVVVLADNVFTFLLLWELMALLSFVLVVHGHHDGAVRRAGFVYLVMSHLGAAFLTVAYLALFAQAGSFEFAAFRFGSGALPGLSRDLIFLLALVGFGTKAGMIPLHVWLPRAHPAAPSHVSALMSGVMIMTAIYGLVRFVFEFLAPAPAWWGLLVAALGAISAVLGILYALMERDLKRLLAYSSVEHVGIVLVALGAAIYLNAGGHAGPAAIALAAALFHVLNHATFKGLLFLGAGAVQHAAHTRDLERMGGLLRRMPWTGGFFLVGSAAIASLPPLNGFVSEWLIFQVLLLLGPRAPDPSVSVGTVVVVALLALTAALSAACFVKAFGIAFLALPRTPGAATAHEAGRPMLVAMGGLALACAALGLAPALVFGPLDAVTRSTLGASVLAQVGAGGWLVTTPAPAGVAPPALAPGVPWLLLAVLAAVALLVGRVLGGPTRTRRDETWACGVTLRPQMEYTATAFSKAIRLIFARILRAERHVERHYTVPYFIRAIRYRGAIRPFSEDWFYYRSMNVVIAVSGYLRGLQSGSIRLYLGYIFATLVVLLLVVR